MKLQFFVRRSLISLLLITGAPGSGNHFESSAQQRDQQPLPSPAPTTSVRSNLLPSSGEDYRIGPGDVINVSVDRAEELSSTFRVGADGTIPMKYLGLVEVQQKTPREVSRLIADRLRDRYLKDPYVSVTVTQYNSRTLFIHGAVQSPGTYQIEGQPSLLSLITLAGGLVRDHGSTAFVIRKAKTPKLEPVSNPASEEGQGSPRTAEGGQYEMFSVNISSLLKGNFTQNFDVEPGDIVNIPLADIFFISGEVRRPGSFTLKDGTTLRQAVSLAEGFTLKARAGHTTIFREDPTTGRRQEIPIDLGAVMAGKQPDMPLKANDVIVVPNSMAKTVGGFLLNGFGVSSIMWAIR